MIETKKCCTCKRLLPLASFTPTAQSRRSAQCNGCITEARNRKLRAVGKKPTFERIAEARENILGIEHQRCSHCQIMKPLTDFPPSAVAKPNSGASCSKCMNEEQQKRRWASGVRHWEEVAIKRETRGGVDYQECPECSKLKPLSDFHKNSSFPNGRDRHCKVCASARYFSLKDKVKIGVPLKKAEIVTLVCEGCGKPFDLLRSRYDAAVKEGDRPKYCSTKCSDHWCHPTTSTAHLHSLLSKYGKTGGKVHYIR